MLELVIFISQLWTHSLSSIRSSTTKDDTIALMEMDTFLNALDQLLLSLTSGMAKSVLLRSHTSAARHLPQPCQHRAGRDHLIIGTLVRNFTQDEHHFGCCLGKNGNSSHRLHILHFSDLSTDFLHEPKNTLLACSSEEHDSLHSDTYIIPTSSRS